MDDHEDPHKYVSDYVGCYIICAVCRKHDYGGSERPQFFKAGGEGLHYHLPCLARLLGGYRMVIVSSRPEQWELEKIALEGSGLF